MQIEKRSRRAGGVRGILSILALIQLLPWAAEAGQYLGLTYATDGESVTITAYTGPGGPVDIPGAINGLPVTRIRANAFAYRYDVTGVTIPNSVTSIGEAAFDSCGVVDMVIPESVTHLGNLAFFSAGMRTVSIPNSLTALGGEVFA